MQAFNQSLEQNYYIKTQRKYDGKQRFFFLAHPSLAKKWGLINAHAEATYNGFINTIEIDPYATIKESGKRTRLKTIEELKQKDEYAYSVKVGTIFHEIAHAEFDIYVENGVTSEDKTFYDLVKTEIKPWFKRNFPKTNSTIAVSELFAYYRTDVIERFHEDIESILMQNGINRYKQKCFKPRLLKEMAKQMSLEEFSKFLVMPKDQIASTPYRDRIGPNYIYVKGKDLKIKGDDVDFQESWMHALWDHFAAFHSPPASKADLVKAMNKSHPLNALLKNCRKALWNELSGEDASKETKRSNELGFDDITNQTN